LAKRPFKFENVSLEVDGYSNLVKFFWWELNVSGSFSFILAKKLCFLKSKLKDWNRDVFGHLDTKMADLVDKVKRLDEKQQQQCLTFADIYESLDLKKEFSKVCNWIDIFWRHRAKKHWIEEEDRNTKFFHRMANSRRKFNAIHNIKVDDEYHVESSSIKYAITQF